MEKNDVRWKQRLSNLKLALDQLSDATLLAKQRDLTLLEQQGLIQAFKFTHEFSWNVMKDFFSFRAIHQLLDLEMQLVKLIKIIYLMMEIFGWK